MKPGHYRRKKILETRLNLTSASDIMSSRRQHGVNAVTIDQTVIVRSMLSSSLVNGVQKAG